MRNLKIINEQISKAKARLRRLRAERRVAVLAEQERQVQGSARRRAGNA